MGSGIPYFPLDVGLDDKFKLLEAEFGIIGFGVVVKIFQKIYGDRGYYIEWTEDVALLFCAEIRQGGGVVSEIISAAIRRGIFDTTLHEKYNILTSKGIQDRYFNAVERRKNVEAKEAYLLINVSEKYPNVNISSENVNIPKKNAGKSKQRKADESILPPLPPQGDARERLDYAGIVKLFNDECPSFPQVKSVSDKRKKALREARLVLDEYEIKGQPAKFGHLFRRSEHSDYLSGRDGKWLNCCFDWIVKPDNIRKIMEGGYPNQKPNNSNGGGSAYEPV